MPSPIRARLSAVAVLAATGVIALGACGSLSDGGSASQTTLAVASTSFRTIPITATTAPATTAPPASATPVAEGGGATEDGPGVYTVRTGDAWYLIARRLAVDVNALLAANGMTLETPLYTGMKLRVPGADTSGGTESTGDAPPSTDAPPTTLEPGVAGVYIVKSGDAWPYIARKLGVKTEDLLRVNGATLETPIYPDQKLKIPAG